MPENWQELVDRFDHEFVHRREFAACIRTLNERMDQMSTQADVDQLTAQLAQVETDLQTSTSTLQSELDALAEANPSLDLSALQAAVSPLDAQVQALGALKPAAPDPSTPVDPNAPTQ